MTAHVIRGDARRLPLADGTVDAIVCDPPYDLTAGKRGGTGPASLNLDSPYGRARIGTGGNGGGFMGKAWDATGVAFDPATWVEALRVAKPGGYLVAFGGTRTFHRLACAIEAAGFEIRDSIMLLGWVYGSGFPKSLDAARWQGFGTALKPAIEPIILARKPLAGTVAQNGLTYGTGGLNIDGCRVGLPEDKRAAGTKTYAPSTLAGGTNGRGELQPAPHDGLGRWPTNLLLSHAPLLDNAGQVTGDACEQQCVPGCHVAEMDRQSGVSHSSPRMPTGRDTRGIPNGNTPVTRFADTEQRGHGDSGGASRFFPVFRYEPKAGPDERPTVIRDGQVIAHPTVKPVDLMRWLVRLVTPPGGLVLDPFAGSGATLQAAHLEGFRAIGIELDADSCALARERLSWPVRINQDGKFQRLQPAPTSAGQGTLFDLGRPA